MSESRRLLVALLATVSMSGCQGARSHRSAAVSEPGLFPPGDGSAEIVEVQPSRTITFRDRHPLLAKPREYYDRGGHNKASKIAAATVVGVPAGIVGELRQIVVGRPPDASY